MFHSFVQAGVCACMKIVDKMVKSQCWRLWWWWFERLFGGLLVMSGGGGGGVIAVVVGKLLLGMDRQRK